MLAIVLILALGTVKSLSADGCNASTMELICGALKLVDELLLIVKDLLSAVLNVLHLLIELVEGRFLLVKVCVEVIKLFLKAPHLVHKLGALVEVGVDLVLELVFLLSGRCHHLR